MIDAFQSVTSDSLASVTGGDGNPGLCFDHMAAWGVPAAAGGGYLGGVPGASSVASLVPAVRTSIRRTAAMERGAR